MLLESKLLSKILLEKDYWIIKKYNIQDSDFTEYKAVYHFIESFVKEYGHTPDYRTVVEKFQHFEMQVEVFDSFAYLCKALKKHQAKLRVFNVLQNQAGKNFKEKDIDEFISWMDDEIQSAKTIIKSSTGMGSNYANNGRERRERYMQSKELGSGIFIKTPYPTLNEYLDGGMELGDYVLIQAFSNKGKSWIASHVGTHAWRQGNAVLHYSPELSKAQQENRNDTLIGHFNNIAIRNGALENENDYLSFLDKFEENETPYIIKTMEDIEYLDTDTIESDLKQNPNTKVVIIDGFNLMTHGKGKLDRNSMSQTSRKLRQIFGKYGVLGIVVHQVNASEEKENQKRSDDDINPMPKPASIMGYSETIAVVQDACTILSFDAVNGLGQIFIAKCRGTGKEKTVDLNINYNMGYITEASPVDHF